jgi:ADP-dependent NAD(P)H-hydrate dehydratase / NAD(P)H-hydrate epimerase
LAALNAKPRCPLVLDADAITLLAPMTHGLEPHDVMTPHVGEFRRAFPGIWSNSANPIEAARAAAAYARCVVLLKGASTVIAAPDGRAIVNTTGTPFLATAGAGVATFEAAAAAAWIHGRAGEAFGPGLTADDLPDILAHTLNSLAPPHLRRRTSG